MLRSHEYRHITRDGYFEGALTPAQFFTKKSVNRPSGTRAAPLPTSNSGTDDQNPARPSAW